jgi:hypothetical protein
MNQIETEKQNLSSEKVDTTETNLANMRKKLDLKEQKLEEKERLLKQAQEEALLYKQQLQQDPKAEKQPTNPLYLKDTEYVDVNLWNSMIDQIEAINKETKQTAIEVSKTALADKHDDFKTVFTEKNLQKLAEEKPELVMIVKNSTGTPYQKMATLYYGITGKTMAKKEDYQDLEKRAQEIDSEMNQLKKVQSMPTGKSQTPFPDVKGRKLSPEMEDQLYNEMMEYMPSHLQ